MCIALTDLELLPRLAQQSKVSDLFQRPLLLGEDFHSWSVISLLRLKEATSKFIGTLRNFLRLIEKTQHERHNFLLIVKHEPVRLEHYTRSALYQLRILLQLPR
jgi:hypothetical protein